MCHARMLRVERQGHSGAGRHGCDADTRRRNHPRARSSSGRNADARRDARRNARARGDDANTGGGRQDAGAGRGGRHSDAGRGRRGRHSSARSGCSAGPRRRRSVARRRRVVVCARRRRVPPVRRRERLDVRQRQEQEEEAGGRVERAVLRRTLGPDAGQHARAVRAPLLTDQHRPQPYGRQPVGHQPGGRQPDRAEPGGREPDGGAARVRTDRQDVLHADGGRPEAGERDQPEHDVAAGAGWRRAPCVEHRDCGDAPAGQRDCDDRPSLVAPLAPFARHARCARPGPPPPPRTPHASRQPQRLAATLLHPPELLPLHRLQRRRLARVAALRAVWGGGHARVRARTQARPPAQCARQQPGKHTVAVDGPAVPVHEAVLRGRERKREKRERGGVLCPPT
eukprot:Rhum_TRINITY_DN14752_c1_g1::Rhum_TRINITY_DN14752_c1_g1_i1::g.115521::m.115521